MTDPRDERIAQLANALRVIWLEFQDSEGIMDGHDCDWHAAPQTGRCTICPLVELVDAALTPNPDAAPPSFGEWQPIETAPKDGTEILAWRHDAGVFTAHFVEPEDAAEADWFTTSGEHLPGDERPTHWMPLPAPPTPIEEGEKALRGEETQEWEEPTC